MTRRLATLAAVASLGLCVATLALYVRSFEYRDELVTSVFRHHCIVATFPHHAHIVFSRWPATRAHETSLSHGLAQYPSHPKYVQPRASSTGVYWEISIPFWLPLIFTACVPPWLASQVWRRHRLAKLGLCPTCGYDLRATPARCPECGGVPAAAAAR